MRSIEPRAAKRRTKDGEGPRWELLREDALERDDRTCQRCGYEQSMRGDPQRDLEVHHVTPYESPSIDELEKLVTLCRPCHATVHADDPAYGDLRKDAPMFPDPDAPAAVSTMRSDRRHVCQRCQHLADSAIDLATYTHEAQPYVLCRPCAGALLEAGYDPDAFEVAGELDTDGLRIRATEAPVRPAMLASRPVRALRPPRTTFERVVYDTPLRYVLNPLGITLLFILVGVFFSLYLF
jgi:hypothetical protein